MKLFTFLLELWYNNLWWRSILVSSTGSQDGPKNPLKGTSMKFLVLAFDASRGLMLGVKDLGRFAMACKTRPLFRGDPNL